MSPPEVFDLKKIADDPPGPARARRAPRICYGLLAAVGVAALSVHLSLWLEGSGGSVAAVARTLVAFFAFFTNVINAAVTVVAVRLAWRFDGPFARPRAATALAAYVTVVFAVYELALRHLWHPRGLTLVLDTVFHDVMPLAYVTLWATFVRKGTLRWRDAAWWLIGPVAYGVWIAGLGWAGGESPYPFLSIDDLGAARVAVTVVVLLGVFWGVGLGYVAVDRRAGRRRGGERSGRVEA